MSAFFTLYVQIIFYMMWVGVVFMAMHEGYQLFKERGWRSTQRKLLKQWYDEDMRVDNAGSNQPKKG